MSRDNKGIKTRKNGNFGEEKYTESITRHLALKRAARRRRAGTRCRVFSQTDRYILRFSAFKQGAGSR